MEMSKGSTLYLFLVITLVLRFDVNATIPGSIHAQDVVLSGGTSSFYGGCPGCPQPPPAVHPPPPPPAVCPEPIPPPPPPPPPPPLPVCPEPTRPPPPPKPSTIPAPPPYTPPIELQRALDVIRRFKATITYDPLGITKTWTGNRICIDSSTYKGFICDTTISDNKIRVALVNFNGFRFDGNPLELTNFLDGLTDLIVFHVNSNNFTGQVPSGISKISSLFEFDLSNNEIKGGFPKAVLTATNLTFLDLRFNKLTGELPPQVFTLDLDVLFLNNNQFVGDIPQNIGQTPVLYLTLANNNFQGPIPRSIGQISNTLLEALLLNNKLSGCLPYEIGLLHKAIVFDVSQNHLTGPIPQSFGCLNDMQYLNLSYNKFYGAVPESLCKLSDLFKLTLKFNYFTQVGPECRKLIKNKVLDIKMNCVLDLPEQRSAEECEAFFLKRFKCSDQYSLYKVPCKINYSALPEKSRPHRRLMAQPRTYAALQRY